MKKVRSVADVLAIGKEDIANKHVPEAMRDFEFKRMIDVEGVPVEILAFSAYENFAGNRGYNVLIKDGMGKVFRLTTLAVAVVDLFGKMDENGVRGEDIGKVVFRMSTWKGRNMWVVEDADRVYLGNEYA